MNGNILAQKIGYGLGRAATQVGTTHTQYRPLGSVISNPISLPYNIGTLSAAFTLAGGMKPGAYPAQAKADQLYWQAIAPVLSLKIGDYLVGVNTYCIVGLDNLVVPIALRCTQTLTFSRPTTAAPIGLQGYSSFETQPAVVYASDIPCTVNLKKQTGKSETHLPGDPALRAFYDVTFYLPEGTVQHRDIATDAFGVRYQVVSVSSGLLGTQALVEILET